MFPQLLKNGKTAIVKGRVRGRGKEGRDES
jgi:hypothetical protein